MRDISVYWPFKYKTIIIDNEEYVYCFECKAYYLMDTVKKVDPLAKPQIHINMNQERKKIANDAFMEYCANKTKACSDFD